MSRTDHVRRRQRRELDVRVENPERLAGRDCGREVRVAEVLRLVAVEARAEAQFAFVKNSNTTCPVGGGKPGPLVIVARAWTVAGAIPWMNGPLLASRTCVVTDEPAVANWSTMALQLLPGGSPLQRFLHVSVAVSFSV